ncbi:hypothetical protein VOLCADRAFT_109778 [Volvox carteri f. nagariensis]|uniref:Uncharacterized protein n=1 Tax=Volvox carteri f. nagariensis TaxID=3068 RepID=D8TWI1_VOLCA|nr:uncharacterized protein VOLCADRAFT_109778 [Volvox carteri f. nagariensis]EFJ48049.1 hypothetical protein VOLCADRAFT_109778 [Volvox carteri f. nagariensis]|eukprot:XP_002950734.1 hypothetical protein VOLCADRAFT_109778 [Volvox carteri f. nagariensis]
MASSLLRPQFVACPVRSCRIVPFGSAGQLRKVASLASNRQNVAADELREGSVPDVLGKFSMPALATLASLVLAEAPASAEALISSNPFAGVQANSLYVTLALFLMSVPGIWSLVKRAPQAAKKRLTFEVPGPAVEGAMPLDDRARQIFRYFKRYNYSVKETGEVITFEGVYAADKGQAAALVFYTFCAMASVALVLSILVPAVGNWWYALTAVSPAAYTYYMQKGTRPEQFKVKMVTADDEKTTDIIVEGDKEEIERFWKELGLVEKGKVYVKGMLEA